MTTREKSETQNSQELPQADASVISRDWSAADITMENLESLLQSELAPQVATSRESHSECSVSTASSSTAPRSEPSTQAAGFAVAGFQETSSQSTGFQATGFQATGVLPRTDSIPQSAPTTNRPAASFSAGTTAGTTAGPTTSQAAGNPGEAVRAAASPASASGSGAEGGLPTPTIDWNTLPPDGTDAALERLAASVGSCFRACVFLGSVSASGHLVKLVSTDKVWTTMKKKPLWLKNMITEAAQATRPLGSAPVCGMMTAVMLQANHQLGAKHVFGIGLQLESGLPKFAVTMAQDAGSGEEDAATAIKQLMSLAPALSQWLTCWQRCATGRTWLQRKNRVTDAIKARPKTIAVFMAVLTALMWVPLPYWPKRECVLEPTVRQYVASPIAGRVLEAAVRPGDTVRKDQLLAHLDDEQLRWDLSTAQAEYEAAAKKRDTALANKSAGNMRVAQLELEQIAVRIEAIKSNLDRLSVSSPVDGVVLQGEWFRSPGAPVNRGDCLFEIAPLERMTVETHLRTEDLGQIHVGDEITLRVDSASDRTWDGKIGRIDPRAKVVEDKVVFVAEVEVADAAEALRPGMKGTVTVSAGPRTIGWLLFNRPYHWLMKKLLW